MSTDQLRNEKHIKLIISFSVGKTCCAVFLHSYVDLFHSGDKNQTKYHKEINLSYCHLCIYHLHPIS